MFHNISNPKWFGNWSRLEDDYLGNGGTDIADNFTFSKMEKTGGLFGSIIRLATAFPACDPETGHATGAWKGTSPLSVDPEAGRRLSMISGTVSLRAATTFPWRATTAHPAGMRSRRMHLQGMRPERMTRTSDRTRSDKNRKTGCRIPYGSGISTNAKKNGRCE